MHDFLKNLVNGNTFDPPEICTNSFNEKFEGAVNIEWFDRSTYYETIFYKDQIEYIAIFGLEGELQEYKMFLPLAFLPEAIKRCLEERGEIMNVVFVNKGNTVIYEAILRDTELNRFLLLLTDMGKVIHERSL